MAARRGGAGVSQLMRSARGSNSQPRGSVSALLAAQKLAPRPPASQPPASQQAPQLTMVSQAASTRTKQLSFIIFFME